MNGVDLLIVVPVIALVVFSIVYNLRRRKNKECGCYSCRNCPGCHPTHEKNEEK